MKKQTKPTFTPGPLLVGSCYNEVNKVIPKVFAKDGPMFILIDGEDDETNRANAALIAAAPDMFSLLSDIQQHLESGNDIILKRDLIVLSKLEATLKKARGES